MVRKPLSASYQFLSHACNFNNPLITVTGDGIAEIDPIFFSPRVNLDGFWWEWHQPDPETRLFAYNGQASSKGSFISDCAVYGHAQCRRLEASSLGQGH